MRVRFHWQQLLANKDLMLPLAAICFIVIFGGFFVSRLKNSANVFKAVKAKNERSQTINVGGVDVKVELAITPAEHQIGLSGRKKMGSKEGLLFVFPENNVMPSFWMKDMLFSIDIIWINDDEIIQIHQKVPTPKPEDKLSDLLLYKPYVPVDYVLEVNAGFVEKHNIAVRDKVDLTKVLN